MGGDRLSRVWWAYLSRSPPAAMTGFVPVIASLAAVTGLLFEAEITALADYCYTNQLMVRCKEAAVRVSLQHTRAVLRLMATALLKTITLRFATS